MSLSEPIFTKLTADRLVKFYTTNFIQTEKTYKRGKECSYLEVN